MTSFLNKLMQKPCQRTYMLGAMLHLIAVAWLFVCVLAAAAEATSPTGSLIGAGFTLLLYGLLPLGIVLYLGATPHRRRARLAREASDRALQSDGGNHPSPGPTAGLASVGEESLRIADGAPAPSAGASEPQQS